jgi:uncharacterized Tic20 family protein
MQSQPLDSKICHRAMTCHLLGLAWVPMIFIIYLIFHLILYLNPIPSSGKGDWVLVFFMVFIVLPLISMIVTTVLILTFWQFSKNIHAFVDLSGREITNFMLSNSLYMLIFVTLTAMTCGIIPLGKSTGDFVGLFIPYFLILEPIILILHFSCIVIGAIQTRKGRIYRYPLSIHFLREST